MAFEGFKGGMTGKKIYVHRQNFQSYGYLEIYRIWLKNNVYGLMGAGRGVHYELNLKKFLKRVLASFLGKSYI